MSDASAGQIVGGVVGAVAGFVVGGGPVGAVQGFTIGYGIGGYIDPPDGPYIKAPTLDDQTFQSSAYGTDIPTMDGTAALHGNVIYLENGKYKQTISEEEQEGKGGGGGATVETVSYSATFAVSLSEAVPNAKVRRIWLGGKLVYNISIGGEPVPNDGSSVGTAIGSGEEGKLFNFYDGTQTEPDPRIESVLPSGEAESYEGTAYIIFNDLPLAEYGNSLAGCPVKVEIVSNADQQQTLVGNLYRSFSQSVPGSVSRYSLAQSFSRADFYAMTTERTGGNAPFDRTIDKYKFINGRWSKSSDFKANDISSPPYGLNDGGIIYNDMAQATGIPFDPTGRGQGGYQARNVSATSIGDWAAFGVSQGDDVITERGNIVPEGSSGFVICLAVDESGDFVYVMTSTKIYKYTYELTLITSINHNIPSPSSTAINGSRMWHSDGYLWLGTGGNNESAVTGAPTDFYKIPDDISAISLSFTLPPAWQASPVTLSPREFCVIGSVLYRGGTDARDSGQLHCEQWALNTVGDYSDPLDSVCEDIISRSGIASQSFDSSELAGDLVRGYIRPVGDGRGALSQLQAAFLFDVVQIGYKLKAVKRGANPVLTIPYGDLGAKKSGGSPVDRLGISRQMDTVLPSNMEVRYLDYLREYDKGSQSAVYPTSSFNVKQVDFALSLNNDEAAKLADVLINAAWSERTKFNFSLPQKYLSLIVSDVVSIQTPQRNYEVRIESINTNENQTLQVSGALSAPALWESDAKGAEGVIPDDTVGYTVDSQATLVDAPMILNSTDYPGFASQMSGPQSWSGGSLYRSLDGGQTFTNLKSYIATASVGECLDFLPESDGFVIDRVNYLNINLLSGSFGAITETQMMTGKHWCAYGADGRWELIRYIDATLNLDNSITLSGFVRGARGTEWAAKLHQQGDLVVLLDSPNTQFLSSDSERIGVSENYKSVSFGQNITSVESFEFTYRAVNLMPLSPVLPVANKGNDWIISCTTRTRYQGNFWVSGNQPMNESTLIYDLDILDGGSVVRTIQNPSPDFVYTEAQQVEDFGVAQDEIKAKCYQVSDRVGRGLPLLLEFVSDNFLSPNNPDLLAFYTMSNVSGSTLIDESPNGNNGTLVNSPTIVPGRFGGAMLFNGSNQYAEVNSELPSSVTEFSWSFWIEYISGNGIANYYGEALGGDTVFCTINSSLTSAQSREQGGQLYSSQSPAVSGLHHMVVNYQKQGFIDVYIDGLLASSTATNISGAIESSINTIGAAYVGNYNFYFNGTIEQKRTFNRVLTQAEITLLANET